MVFKCKICGGNLDVQTNSKIATCEYCGTKQTLPKLENERIANLYDRANHLRRNNEYDKAEGLYEMILNEDSSDAEAYWSLLLCKYGVEYVKDPNTQEYIPTCNRTQKASILADENYKQALEHASDEQRELYKSEANKINEIQKGILEISRKEAPYDVFICYKETDEDGDRTEDSVLAQDIYSSLIKEGLRVFFSRITLEDKIGTAYEPYIFSALNSSKVMLVVGTKKENFNAVWVRNEWSRFLALAKDDEEKVLIPCYSKMDAYDLPEEFAHLQAQNMEKIGFIQDLTRGVLKIVNSNKVEQNVNISSSGMTNEQKEEIYSNAIKNMEVTTNAKVLSHREKKKIYKNLATDFERVGAYKDAPKLAEKCYELNKTEKRKSLMLTLRVLIVLLLVLAIAGTVVYTFAVKPNNEYEAALDKYNNKEYYSAIKAFNELGDYKDSQQLIETSKNNWRISNLGTVSGDSNKIYAVKEIGSVFNLSSVFNSFSNIVQIETSSDYIFGLKDDGTVLVYMQEENQEDRDLLSSWNNIISIKASDRFIFGLKDNGTVLTQQYKEYEEYETTNGDIDTSDWTQIVQVLPCLGGVVGLKEDGTLVRSGIDRSAILNIDEWNDVVQLTGGRYFLIGLKADGTLVGAGSNGEGVLNIENETDVIQLSSNNYSSGHFAFIKSDGTIKALGENFEGQCNLSTFDDIVFLYAGDTFTIGITKDATISIVGQYEDSNYNGITTWTGLKIYNEWRSVK